VSFREPLLLLGLALVPLALAAYVVAQRRRRRFAVRYTNVDVLATVAARSAWTRHIPALLALLALAALLIALARPERTVAAEQRQAMVVMVTDVSGSMRATDVAPDRLTAAQEAGRALVDKLPRDFRLGLVGFSHTASLLVEPTTDKQRVRAGIEGLTANGGTAMGDGLALGLQAARTPVSNELGVPQRLPSAIVLLSDGTNTAGREDPMTVAERARELRVPVYAVALGTATGTIEHTRLDGSTWTEPVPPDAAMLQEIARETRGRFYQTADAQRLTEIYRGLGTRLATRREKQEVTAAFAGGGLALLVLGMAAAMARSGRLP
jgi:Ca-activated chloride channel family protein